MRTRGNGERFYRVSVTSDPGVLEEHKTDKEKETT